MDPAHAADRAALEAAATWQLEGLPERDGLRPATVLVDVVETVGTLISGDALRAENWSAVTEALAKQIRLTNRFPA